LGDKSPKNKEKMNRKIEKKIIGSKSPSNETGKKD